MVVESFLSLFSLSLSVLSIRCSQGKLALSTWTDKGAFERRVYCVDFGSSNHESNDYYHRNE